MRLLPLVCCAASFIGNLSVDAENLIVNGSFEAPLVDPELPQLYPPGTELDGWIVVGPEGSDVAIINGGFVQLGLTFNHDDGEQSLDLNGVTNMLSGVSQRFDTVAGREYVLAFAHANVQSEAVWGTESTVEVLIDGGSVGLFTKSDGPTDTLAWETVVLSFVADGEETELTFLNRDPTSDNVNQIDSVSVTEAVELPDAVLTGKRWKMTGLDEANTSWSGSDLVFTSQRASIDSYELDGYFIWRDENGFRGRELFQGTLSTEGMLELEGYELVEPNNIILASYVASIDLDSGQIVNGSWQDGIPGEWSAVIVPELLFSRKSSANELLIQWNAYPSTWYRIERGASLTDEDWLAVESSWIEGTGEKEQFTLDLEVSETNVFFRVAISIVDPD